MGRPIPTVRGDRLIDVGAGEQHTVTVGSPAWYAWLDQATTFTFESAAGRFWARKERATAQRRGAYWYAYRKQQGKRHKAYLGRSSELSLARLMATAARLAGDAPDVEKPRASEAPGIVADLPAPLAPAAGNPILATK